MNQKKVMSSWIIVIAIIGIGYTIRHFYLKPKYKQGEKMEDFSATLIDGTSFKLSDLDGKFVLLDFWGSWCGPCRRENPEVVALYRDTHTMLPSQFEIVSIALEQSQKSWERAIIQDELSWPYHIGEFETFTGPIAKKYGVREIPTKYFLDQKGKVIMINPTFDKIRAFLKDKNIL